MFFTLFSVSRILLHNKTVGLCVIVFGMATVPCQQGALGGVERWHLGGTVYDTFPAAGLFFYALATAHRCCRRGQEWVIFITALMLVNYFI